MSLRCAYSGSNFDFSYHFDLQVFVCSKCDFTITERHLFDLKGERPDDIDKALTVHEIAHRLIDE